MSQLKKELFKYYNRYRRYFERQFTWDTILENARKYAKGNCLDIGCGSGDLVVTIARALRDVWFIGIDVSKIGIKAARKKASQLKLSNVVDFLVGDVECLPLRKDIFDTITCRAVLEHLPNPDYCIKEMARVCRPGGHMIIKTNNCVSPFIVVTETGVERGFMNPTDALRNLIIFFVRKDQIKRFVEFVSSWMAFYLLKRPFPKKIARPSLAMKKITGDFEDLAYMNNVVEIKNHLEKAGVKLTLLDTFGGKFGLAQKIPIVKFLGPSITIIAEKYHSNKYDS